MCRNTWLYAVTSTEESRVVDFSGTDMEIRSLDRHLWSKSEDRVGGAGGEGDGMTREVDVIRSTYRTFFLIILRTARHDDKLPSPFRLQRRTNLVVCGYMYINVDKLREGCGYTKHTH